MRTCVNDNASAPVSTCYALCIHSYYRFYRAIIEKERERESLYKRYITVIHRCKPCIYLNKAGGQTT